MGSGLQRSDVQQRLRAAIRDVHDFPKPGIVFRDITPVLADPHLLRDVIDTMAARWQQAGVTHVAGVESRGFILAAPIALALGTGFIPIRKPGKLPWRTASVAYALEYGTDRLEMHIDACTTGSRVLVVDDVLATGGTAAAACAVTEQVGGTIVGCSFLLSLSAFDGPGRLTNYAVDSVLAL